jgi:beta-glucosidase
MRIGLEWARIQPEPDSWNVDAINHYRDELAYLKENGFTTIVTLFHWNLPLWVAEKGGWENSETIQHFHTFVEVVIKEIGADIDYWITFNEPTAYAVNGWIRAKWMPGKRFSFIKWHKVLSNIVRAHRNAYSQIHGYFKKSKVSISMNLVNFEPAHKNNPIEVLFAWIARKYNKGDFLKKVADKMDYLGVNYYFHYRIVCYPPFYRNKNEQVTDVGWEVYPEGLYEVLKSNYENLFLPIMITEDGLADAQDKIRADYIQRSVTSIQKAMDHGVKVIGYMHWSLLDNFEWEKGYGPKFGLIEVDRSTMERKVRPSALVYKEIINSKQ